MMDKGYIPNHWQYLDQDESSPQSENLLNTDYINTEKGKRNTPEILF